MGRAFSRVCPTVRALRQTAWAISTKLGTHILYSSRLACIDPEVKRSKVKVTRLRKQSRLLVTGAAMAVCWCFRYGSPVCMSMWLPKYSSFCVYLTSFFPFPSLLSSFLCFLSYLFTSLIVYFLTYLSTPFRIYLFRYHAGDHRRRPDLALVFWVDFML